MDTRLAKRNYSIQQWKAIIHDRNNTNLTVDEYCKQNGLSRNSYFYWLRIIREEALEQSAESGFVELSLPAETDSGSHPITAVPIAKPEPSQLTLSVCGITIQVTEDTSPEHRMFTHEKFHAKCRCSNKTSVGGCNNQYQYP